VTAFAFVAAERAANVAIPMKSSSRTADASIGADADAGGDASFDAILSEADQPQTDGGTPAADPAQTGPADPPLSTTMDVRAAAEDILGRLCTGDSSNRASQAKFATKTGGEAVAAIESASMTFPAASAAPGMTNARLASQMAEARMAEAKAASADWPHRAGETSAAAGGRSAVKATPAHEKDGPESEDSPKKAVAANDAAGLLGADAVVGQASPLPARTDLLPVQAGVDRDAALANAAATDQIMADSARSVLPPVGFGKSDSGKPDSGKPDLSESDVSEADLGVVEAAPLAKGQLKGLAKGDPKAIASVPSVQVVGQRAFMPPVAADWTPKASASIDPAAAKPERALESALHETMREKPSDELNFAAPLADAPVATGAATTATLTQGGVEIAKTAKSAAPEAASPSAPGPEAAKPSLPATAARRDLEITLAPKEWGGLSVRMKSAGDRLDIAFVADREETARMIADQSPALTHQLNGAGVGLGGVEISSVAARPEPIGAAPASGDSFSSSNADGQGGSTATPQRRDAAPGKERNHSDDTGDARPSASSGGVYL